MLARTQTHKQPSHWFVCNVTNHYRLPICLFTLLQISKNHHKQVLSFLGGEFTLLSNAISRQYNIKTGRCHWCECFPLIVFMKEHFSKTKKFEFQDKMTFPFCRSLFFSRLSAWRPPQDLHQRSDKQEMGWKLTLPNEVALLNEHVRQSGDGPCYPSRGAFSRPIICTHLYGYARTQRRSACARVRLDKPSRRALPWARGRRRWSGAPRGST